MINFSSSNQWFQLYNSSSSSSSNSTSTHTGRRGTKRKFDQICMDSHPKDRVLKKEIANFLDGLNSDNEHERIDKLINFFLSVDLGSIA